MSFSLKNESHTVGTAVTTVYTCSYPANSSIVFGMTLSNILGSGITVDVELYDLSETTFIKLLADDTAIAVGETLTLAGGIQKIVLELGDYIRVTCGTLAGVDVVVSAIDLK